MAKITTTRAELAKAFERWLDDWQKNPRMFSSTALTHEKPKTYGENCADHLIERLGK